MCDNGRRDVGCIARYAGLGRLDRRLYLHRRRLHGRRLVRRRGFGFCRDRRRGTFGQRARRRADVGLSRSLHRTDALRRGRANLRIFAGLARACVPHVGGNTAGITCQRLHAKASGDGEGMSTKFTRAIARRPAPTFADGLTSVSLGVPDYDKVLRQHEAYCDALLRTGVEVLLLDPDDRYPDSTFVEDTAIVARGCAIVTRPGAQSRLGEAAEIRAPLSQFFATLDEIVAPGTVDGGDVCEADDRAFIGLSHRTNREGAEQLAAWFGKRSIPATIVDIRDLDSILHFKSGWAT